MKRTEKIMEMAVDIQNCLWAVQGTLYGLFADHIGRPLTEEEQDIVNHVIEQHASHIQTGGASAVPEMIEQFRANSEPKPIMVQILAKDLQVGDHLIRLNGVLPILKIAKVGNSVQVVTSTGAGFRWDLQDPVNIVPREDQS